MHDFQTYILFYKEQINTLLPTCLTTFMFYLNMKNFHYPCIVLNIRIKKSSLMNNLYS